MAVPRAPEASPRWAGGAPTTAVAGVVAVSRSFLRSLSVLAGPAPSYAALVVRPESWIRPTGASPVRVSVGAPGSRPRSVDERRRAERGVKSLFGGSKRAGRSATRRESCSLVTDTTGEPSRSLHGEGPCPATAVPNIATLGLSGVWGSGTYARPGSEQERPVCAASSAKTARISQW